MASISSTVNTQIDGVPRIVWGPLTSTNDTGTGFKLVGTVGLAGSVQVTGTFNTGTVTLKGSDNGGEYYTLKDRNGNNVSFTAAGRAEFVTSAVYIRPEISGAGTDSVIVVTVLRG